MNTSGNNKEKQHPYRDAVFLWTLSDSHGGGSRTPSANNLTSFRRLVRSVSSYHLAKFLTVISLTNNAAQTK
jgi:hypothetical protein